MKFYKSLLFLALASSSISLSANNIDTARKFIEKKKIQNAITILEPLAKQNDGEAQNLLGEIYHFNLKDHKAARNYYLKAYHNGSGIAANHLGRLYTNGEGVPVNSAEAIQWYKKGMALGYMVAERNYYFSTKNPFYFVIDKAMKNDPEALFVAATFYHYGGKGVKVDHNKARSYYEKALKLNHKDAASRLENLKNSIS